MLITKSNLIAKRYVKPKIKLFCNYTNCDNANSSLFVFICIIPTRNISLWRAKALKVMSFDGCNFSREIVNH